MNLILSGVLVALVFAFGMQHLALEALFAADAQLVATRIVVASAVVGIAAVVVFVYLLILLKRGKDPS